MFDRIMVDIVEMPVEIVFITNAPIPIALPEPSSLYALQFVEVMG